MTSDWTRSSTRTRNWTSHKRVLYDHVSETSFCMFTKCDRTPDVRHSLETQPIPYSHRRRSRDRQNRNNDTASRGARVVTPEDHVCGIPYRVLILIQFAFLLIRQSVQHDMSSRTGSTGTAATNYVNGHTLHNLVNLPLEMPRGMKLKTKCWLCFL